MRARATHPFLICSTQGLGHGHVCQWAAWYPLLPSTSPITPNCQVSRPVRAAHRPAAAQRDRILLCRAASTPHNHHSHAANYPFTSPGVTACALHTGLLLHEEITSFFVELLPLATTTTHMLTLAPSHRQVSPPARCTPGPCCTKRSHPSLLSCQATTPRVSCRLQRPTLRQVGVWGLWLLCPWCLGNKGDHASGILSFAEADFAAGGC